MRGGVIYVLLLLSGLMASLVHVLGLEPAASKPYVGAYVLLLALSSDLASMAREIKWNATGRAAHPLPAYPLLGYWAVIIQTSYPLSRKVLGVLLFSALHIVLLTLPAMIHRRYFNGRTAIHRAALRNDLVGLRRALQRGMDPNIWARRHYISQPGRVTGRWRWNYSRRAQVQRWQIVTASRRTGTL